MLLRKEKTLKQTTFYFIALREKGSTFINIEERRIKNKRVLVREALSRSCVISSNTPPQAGVYP